MNPEAQSIVEEYEATLSELNTISKVQINALTMLADDSKEFAVDIVNCIQNRLKTCPKNEKLPILYLVDSICKNCHGSIYVQLFTQNLVSNFCKVFEVSDDKVRRCLHKLRMTWNDSKTFPEQKLNAIDERVHAMDPNWPVLHKLTSGSQQPVQRAQRTESATPNTVASQPQSQVIHPPTTHMALRSASQPAKSSSTIKNNNAAKRPNAVGATQANGRRKKQRGGTVSRTNQPGEPILLAAVPQPFITPNLIQAPHELTNRVLPTPFLDPNITMGVAIQSDQLHAQISAPTFINHNLIPANQTNGEAHLQTVAPMICPQPPGATTVPVSLPFNQASSAQVSPQSALLDTLYGGKQCSNCSLRFDDDDFKAYGVHLDWHYRQNLKSDNMFKRRKWYYPLNLWVQFREINDDDDLQEASNAEGNTNENLLPADDDDVPTAPASTDDEKNICSVCHETFEKFWAEDEEEWRLKNAKMYDDNRVYHPLCLIDMLQANKVTEVSTTS